jgi:hypothetical protein
MNHAPLACGILESKGPRVGEYGRECFTQRKTFDRNQRIFGLAPAQYEDSGERRGFLTWRRIFINRGSQWA